MASILSQPQCGNSSSLSDKAILVINMLYCFTDYERYIHILNHIFDLAASPKQGKLIL